MSELHNSMDWEYLGVENVAGMKSHSENLGSSTHIPAFRFLAERNQVFP